MRFDLSEDQEFFRETTARFLADKAPVALLREQRHDRVGFEPDYWRQGAELGWTSLLVAEAHGGGSVSGQGLVDLSLVAHEFGAAAAPGPLLPTAVVAGALGAAGGHDDLLAGLLAGTSVATWCFGDAGPHAGLAAADISVDRDGDELVIDGATRPVESAGAASHLLVTGRTGDGVTQVVVPADSPGVTITAQRTIDLTRRFSEVRFSSVRVGTDALVGDLGGAAADLERQLYQAFVIAAAESVGAMATAFEMTVEWAFDRYSFGRPLASYQALKHRFADMATWLQAGHAITDTAATAVADGRPDAGRLAGAAKAFVGHYGSELIQDCVQIHGGIGVTFEHDLHLFLRRHTVNRALWGTPAEHRRRIADLVIEAAA